MQRRRNRRRLLTIFVAVVGAGALWWLFGRDTEPEPTVMAPAELMLTKRWNGDVVRVAGPLTLPPWMREMKAYKRIMERGFATDLVTTGLDGHRYVAHALGRMKNQAGRRFVCFSSIDRHRPDGTPENVTLVAGDAEPFEWKVMNERGERVMFGSIGNSGSYTIAFFEPGADKFEKEWQVDPNLTIYSEQVKGEDGHYHFTHGGRENTPFAVHSCSPCALPSHWLHCRR